MQEIFYGESPYIILNDSNDIEGWRTDRWEGWFTSPSPEGNVVFSPYGAGSFTDGEAKTVATAASGGGGGATTGSVIAVVVAIIAVAWLVLRRQRMAAIEE